MRLEGQQYIEDLLIHGSGQPGFQILKDQSPHWENFSAGRYMFNEGVPFTSKYGAVTDHGIIKL